MRVPQPTDQNFVGLTPDQLATIYKQYRVVLDTLEKQMQPVVAQMRRTLANLTPGHFSPLYVLPPLPSLPALSRPVTAYIQPRRMPPCDHTALEAEVARLQGENERLLAEVARLQREARFLSLGSPLDLPIHDPDDGHDHSN